MEEYFGVKLARRSGRGLVLTDAGEHLAEIIRQQLAALTDFKAECDKTPHKLTIAAGDSLMHWLLLPRLEILKKRLPNVAFVFLNLKSSEIAKRLFEGTIDFGFVRDSGFSLPVRSTAIGTMTHSLFVAKRGTGATNVKKILAELPLATLEGDGTFRRELTSVFKKTGFRIHVNLECSSFPLIARSLKNCKTSAILPSIAKADFKKIDRKIVLAWDTRVSRILSMVEKAVPILTEETEF